MKIRTAFVSNSSSTSFIIKKNDEFKSVNDVAKQIMLGMNKDYSNELLLLEQYKDEPNIPIHFDSYDGTYIRKYKDLILVSTTMHYSSYIFDKYKIRMSEIEKDYFKELEQVIKKNGKTLKIIYCEDLDCYYDTLDDFLLLQYDIRGVPGYNWEPTCVCDSNNNIKLMDKNKSICICKVKNYARKQKLIQIKNKNRKYEN